MIYNVHYYRAYIFTFVKGYSLDMVGSILIYIY